MRASKWEKASKWNFSLLISDFHTQHLIIYRVVNSSNWSFNTFGFRRIRSRLHYLAALVVIDLARLEAAAQSFQFSGHNNKDTKFIFTRENAQFWIISPVAVSVYIADALQNSKTAISSFQSAQATTSQLVLLLPFSLFRRIGKLLNVIGMWWLRNRNCSSRFKLLWHHQNHRFQTHHVFNCVHHLFELFELS